MVKFERVKRLEEEIKLPTRATSGSAGYDFYAIEDIELPAGELTRIPTGVKCEIRPFMVLILANRSSNPSRKNLVLSNGIGVIDSDYYNNAVNDGEIMFEFYNTSEKAVKIKKGEKIGQGFIVHIIRVENDEVESPDAERAGGFGSTGK